MATHSFPVPTQLIYEVIFIQSKLIFIQMLYGHVMFMATDSKERDIYLLQFIAVASILKQWKTKNSEISHPENADPENSDPSK